jgi:signal peptidase I
MLMPTPQSSTTLASIIASLYIQALRQGQALEFRVASSSMNPLLQVDDSVRIAPVKADEIRIGDIAAFETWEGLVIHRIVQLQQSGNAVRLLQMGDVDVQFNATWISEEAVVGRVTGILKGNRRIDLQHPLAQRCNAVTAHLRYRLYRLYTGKKSELLRLVLRKCSRLVVRMNYRCVRSRCSSLVEE